MFKGMLNKVIGVNLLYGVNDGGYIYIMYEYFYCVVYISCVLFLYEELIMVIRLVVKVMFCFEFFVSVLLLKVFYFLWGIFVCLRFYICFYSDFFFILCCWM